MTRAERGALAAALRHGRERYEFRPGWWANRRNCRWYPKPHEGWQLPVLELTDFGDGQWVLEFGINRMATDSVGFALSVLAFFGVYDPTMAEVADGPYRCHGCGKTSRIARHEPGCSVAAAFDRESSAA